jgi:GntR family transcriptional regulator
MIEFYLDPDSGVAPYLQIVRQVRQAIRLGMLKKGDQLPTVKEVVGSLAINPNTVLKAYKELEHAGLVVGRQGIGTFVTATPAATSPAMAPVAQGALRMELERWLRKARRGGLDDEGIDALFRDCVRATKAEEEEIA